MGTRIAMIVMIGAAVIFISPVVHAQSRGPGGWGGWGYTPPRNQYYNYCPECGRPWGPYGGYGMEPRGRWDNEYRIAPAPQGKNDGAGQRQPGYDYGPYYPGYENPPYQRERQKPLDEEKATKMMQSYLDYTGNPNLKLGKVEEKDGVFEGDIVTKKEGSLVDRVIIDKGTGRMRFVE